MKNLINFILLLCASVTLKAQVNVSVTEVSTPNIKFCQQNIVSLRLISSSSSSETINLAIMLHPFPFPFPSGNVEFSNTPNFVISCGTINDTILNPNNRQAQLEITIPAFNTCTLSFEVVPMPQVISSSPISLTNRYAIIENAPAFYTTSIYNAVYPENRVTCANQASDTVTTIGQTFTRVVTLHNSCLTEPMDKPMWFKDTRTGISHPECVRIIEVGYFDTAYHMLLDTNSIFNFANGDTFLLDTSQINQIALGQLDSNFCAQCRLDLILTYEVTCCFNANILCAYNTTWACDANDPPIYVSDTAFNVGPACVPPDTNQTLLVHPNFSEPKLNVAAFKRDMNFCYGPNQLSRDTLRIINHNIPDSTGDATNIIIDLWQGGGNDWTDIIDSTFQIRINNNGPITTLVPDSMDVLYQSCNNNDSCFRRLYLSIDTLAALDTAFVMWRTRTCPPPDICSPSQAPTKDSWKYRIIYDGQCGRDTVAPLYTNLFTRQDIGEMATDFNGPFNISDTVVNNVAVELSEVSVWPANDSLPIPRRLLVRISLGNDLEFVPNTGNIGNLSILLPTLPVSCQTIFPVEDSLVQCDTVTPGVLYATFDISDSACFQDMGLEDFDNAVLYFSFTGLCSGVCASGNAQDIIDTRIYYIPDSTCTPTPMLLVGCNSATVQLMCPGCIRKGIHSLAYDIHRTTFGFRDCDDDNFWDGDSLCQPQVIDEAFALAHPQIKRRRAMVGDVLEGTLHTLVVNNSNYGPVNDTLIFPFAYWRSDITNGYGPNFDAIGPGGPINGFRLRPMDITIVFSPTDSSDTLLSAGPITVIIPDSVLYITHDTSTAKYHLDFSISALNTYFNDTLNPTYDSLPFSDFYDGLAIRLTHRFRVQGNVSSELDCNVNNTIYLGLQPEDSIFNFLIDPDPIFGDTTIFPVQPTTPADYDNYCDSLPSECERFQWYCTHQGGRFRLIGWSFNDFIGGGVVNGRCGGAGLNKQISLNIGNSPGNAGANNFRFEYRNWVNMHRLKWDVPINYLPASSMLYQQYFNQNDELTQLNHLLTANEFIVTNDSVYIDYSYPDSVYQNGVDFNGNPCGELCDSSAFGVLVRPDDDFFEMLNGGYPFLPGCNVPDSTRADFYQEMDFITSGGSSNFNDDEPWGFYADTVFWARFSSRFDTTTYSRHDTIIYKYQQRPQFSISAQSTWNGYRSPECLTFTVNNTEASSNGSATHAWIAFNTDSCVNITSIQVDTTVYNNPVADSLYYFNGVFLFDSSRNVTICFNYNCTSGCDSLRNIYLFSGWDCNRDDSTVATLLQYNDTLGCPPAMDTVQVIPIPANFGAVLTALTPNPSVCDTIEYSQLVRSTSFGALYQIVVTDTLPCNAMTYLPNSAEFIFAGDTISAEPDTSQSQILVWNIDSISLYIDTNGLGFDSLHSVFILNYSIETGCGVCLQQRGIAHIDYITNCGDTGMWRRNFNPLLDSTDAPFNDLSDTLAVSSLNACNNRYEVTVDLFNLNDSTSLHDNNYLEVIVPAGFMPDSFNISPDTIIGQVISWQLDSLSSVIFQLALDTADCGSHEIIANLFVRDTLPCGTDTCFINELASTDTISFMLNPPDSTFFCFTDTILCLEPVQFIPEGLCGYFVWDFGDSTTSNLISPSHVYDTAGTYTVTLTVYGGSSAVGCSASSTCTVVVNCPERLCGGFCTYKPNMYANGVCSGGGNNYPSSYLTDTLPNNFQITFPAPNYLMIGRDSSSACPNAHNIKFTSPTDVRCFLKDAPGGCPGGPATNCVPLQYDFTNPSCNCTPWNATTCCPSNKIRNSFIKEVIALTLTLKFDLADQNFNPNSQYHMAYLTVVNVQPPPLAVFIGMTVQEILDMAHDFIGNCPIANFPAPFNTMSSTDLANRLDGIIQKINTSFNNCQHAQYDHMYDCEPQNNQLIVQDDPENGSCLNANSASIRAWAIGGTPPYHYLWSTSDTTWTISGLSDGTYTVTVIDNNNDSVTATSSVISDSSICCNIAGNPFPQYPDSVSLALNQEYDVNFLPYDKVGFYEEYLKLDSISLNIMEGVQLVVRGGATLELANCTLSACGNMWKGILVETGGILIVDNTIIKDAEIGIYGEDGSKIYVYNSHLTNNVVGIETAVNYSYQFNDIDFAVAGTTFDFADSLHGPYPGQPFFGTIPKAGIVFHNVIGTIGNDAYDENTFSNMNCGILAEASVLVVTNSKFQNIHLEDECYSDLYYMGSGISSSGSGGEFSLEVTPYKYQSTGNPTFNNCDHGVYAEVLNVTVTGCDMDSVGIGINVAQSAGKSVVLANNNIAASNMGINLYSNDGADSVYVGYNSIVTYEESGACIRSDAGGAGMDNLIIEENTLTCAGSLYGIDLYTSYGSTVYHNTIDEVSPGAIGFIGINISGCSQSNVSCNTVNGMDTYDEYTDQGSCGICVSVSDYCVILCNSVNLTTYGIAFLGPCFTENNIKGNEMNEHYEGLRLNSNGLIGEQLHGGNLWFGPFSSSYGADNLNVAGGLSVTASLFVVHEDSVTDYYPSIPDYDSTWFAVAEGGAPYSCSDEDECDERSSEMSMSISPETLDNSIANNNSLSLDFVPETKSMGRQFLYKKLSDTPALLDSSSALEDFYITYSDSSVKSLQQVRDSIFEFRNYGVYYSNSCRVMDSTMKAISDSIVVLDSLMNSDTLNAPTYIAQKGSLRIQANALQSSMITLKTQMQSILAGKISSANTINSSITSAHIPENNEQIINDIYLETVAVGNNNLNGSQASSVLDIAQQCPYAGGKAVYRARTLYKLVDATIKYDDDSTCLIAGIYRMSNQSSTEKIEEGTIQLIPNPAHDNVTVIYQATSDGSCDLYVSDVTGKIVKKISIPCDKTRFEFSIADLKSGLYLVNVLNDQQSIGRSKLAIMR